MSPADDGEVNIFQFGTEGFDGSCYFVLLGNVSRGGDSRVGILLPQFVKQMCPSTNDTDAVAVSSIFFEKCSANAGGRSNDYYSLLFHFVVLIISKIAIIT